jgi:hypothetical protein
MAPPARGVSNYTAVALVGWSGIVLSLDVAYTVDGQRVTFSFRYDALGTTRPAPPAWYEAARNATRTAG